MTVEERLSRLEQELVAARRSVVRTRLLLIGSVLLCAVGGLLVPLTMASAEGDEVADKVVAKRIELVDDYGTPRCIIGQTGGAGVGMMGGQDVVYITLRDGAGKTRAELRVSDDPPDEGGQMIAPGKGWSDLGKSNRGSGVVELRLYDRVGTHHAFAPAAISTDGVFLRGGLLVKDPSDEMTRESLSLTASSIQFGPEFVVRRDTPGVDRQREGTVQSPSLYREDVVLMKMRQCYCGGK